MENCLVLPFNIYMFIKYLTTFVIKQLQRQDDNQTWQIGKNSMA